MASSLSLDLERVAPHARSAAWRQWIQQWFHGLTLAELPQHGPSGGRIRGEALGAGWWWGLDNPCMRIRRDPRKQDAITPLMVVVSVESGQAEVTHAGRSTLLEAGQIYWIDGRLAMDCFTPASSLHIIHLPRDRVLQRHPGCIALAGVSMDADTHPGVHLLRAAVRQIGMALPGLTPSQRACALDAVIELHGLVIDPPAAAAAAPTHDPRVLRAGADLDRHLADPALTPTRLATAQGLSRRHLDALMVQATGQSLAASLWERRLARAATLLRDPALAHHSITGLAYEVGFSSSAHFSRAFKSRYGVTPSQWRNQAR